MMDFRDPKGTMSQKKEVAALVVLRRLLPERLLHLE